MIKYRKDYKYVCSTEGTEQILPTNESNVTSLSPVMDITYGNGGELLENQHFTYRQTAGGGVSDIPENVATVQAIRGQSVVWNQLVRNGGFENGTTGWTNVNPSASTFAVNNGIATITLTASPTSNYFAYISQNVRVTLGHKYFQSIKVFVSKDADVNLDWNSTFLSRYISCQANEWTKFSEIQTCSRTTTSQIAIYPRYVNAGWAIGDYYKVDYYEFFDLTLMFGAGNEPATVEEFEAWLAANVGLKDYYDYNAGEILNVKSTGIKATGFNQWDEEWEVGAYDLTNGSKVPSTSSIRSKGYIKVTPNTSYYFKSTSASGAGRMLFYDSQKGFISYIEARNTLFATPSNAAFVAFYEGSSYGTTYNHDICINLSDTNKNGTYEPYFGSTLPIEVTSMTGKLNGAGQSVTIFPNGMNRIGDVYDEVYVDNGVLKAVKKLGVVDLGTLTWMLLTDGREYLSTSLQNILVKSGTKVNVLCSKYTSIIYLNDSSFINASDKVVSSNQLGNLFIKDSAYSDVATFKTAMSGVMLVYELATPEEYIVDVHKDLTRRIINAHID